jgi:hypothetical protein
MKEGACLMGDVTILAGALAFLGIMRAWDAREEERISRQEEVFVPFKLPPLPQQEQAIDQPITAEESPVAVMKPLSHAWSKP